MFHYGLIEGSIYIHKETGKKVELTSISLEGNGYVAWFSDYEGNNYYCTARRFRMLYKKARGE